MNNNWNSVKESVLNFQTFRIRLMHLNEHRMNGFLLLASNTFWFSFINIVENERASQTKTVEQSTLIVRFGYMHEPTIFPFPSIRPLSLFLSLKHAQSFTGSLIEHTDNMSAYLSLHTIPSKAINRANNAYK